MPGSLSFGLDKKLDVSTVVTDLPTYKVINTLAPINDLQTGVVIGSLFGQKQIIKGVNGNALSAKYSYSATFLPDTNVKGVLSFIFAYTADQLSANGETEVIGTSNGPIDFPVSSGVFLGQEGTARKVKDATDICKYFVDYPFGYANITSNTLAPMRLNTNEYISLDAIDTPSWAISKNNSTELECIEDGKWNFVAQYQLLALQDGQGFLDGFINVNGIDVTDSDAEQSTSFKGETSVLAIGYSAYFNKGDRVKFGLRSSNKDGSGVLRTVVSNIQAPTGLNAPSVIITASRLY